MATAKLPIIKKKLVLEKSWFDNYNNKTHYYHIWSIEWDTWYAKDKHQDMILWKIWSIDNLYKYYISVSFNQWNWIIDTELDPEAIEPINVNKPIDYINKEVNTNITNTTNTYANATRNNDIEKNSEIRELSIITQSILHTPELVRLLDTSTIESLIYDAMETAEKLQEMIKERVEERYKDWKWCWDCWKCDIDSNESNDELYKKELREQILKNKYIEEDNTDRKQKELEYDMPF